MNFLIDTNIVIPMEPTAYVDLEVNTTSALEFHKLVTTSGNCIYLHPDITHDIDRDSNQERAKLRRKLLDRYNFVKFIHPATILDAAVIGSPKEFSNDWVDNHLLASLFADAADYLVTEDVKIHKKAQRLNLADRVLFLSDAVVILKDLFDRSPLPPPAVEDVFVYQLDETDSIFDSLREDYLNFDNWLKKCKREHRKAFIIRDNTTSNLAGVCIIKKDSRLPDGRSGKTLKMCTFKVSDAYVGYRYGELLLKALFDYIKINRYQYTYFTAFPKEKRLMMFAADFGFYKIGPVEAEYPKQSILVKEFEPTTADINNLSAMDLHVKYGPFFTTFSGNLSFIIPIQPSYHKILFPEYESQLTLFPGMHPCGNSIKKAYLSHSKSTIVKRGDNLFFYRSQDYRAITVLGIIEDCKRSIQPTEIARFVGKRTVYTYAEIKQMCKKAVLAIKFRPIKTLVPSIDIDELINRRIINGYPQTITRLQKVDWLRTKVGI